MTTRIRTTEDPRIIGKRGTFRCRIIATKVVRPGLAGLWEYHATKGWRKSPRV